MGRWMTLGEAAAAVGISRTRARYYADSRRWRGVIRTPGGRRLVPIRTVEAFRAAREQASAAMR